MCHVYRYMARAIKVERGKKFQEGPWDAPVVIFLFHDGAMPAFYFEMPPRVQKQNKHKIDCQRKPGRQLITTQATTFSALAHATRITPMIAAPLCLCSLPWDNSHKTKPTPLSVWILAPIVM